MDLMRVYEPELAALEIAEEDLHGIPPYLSTAVETVCSRLRDREAASGTACQSVVFYAEDEWFEGLSDLEKNVTRALSELGLGGSAPEGGPISEIVLGATAHYYPTIVTFPFFVTPMRAQTWRAVDYGFQTQLGLVLHKKHGVTRAALYDSLKSSSPVDPGELARLLVERTNNAHGRLFWRADQIFGEILFHNTPESQRAALRAISQPHLLTPPRINKSAGDGPEKKDQLPPDAFRNGATTKQSQHDVLLFDPLDKNEVEDALGKANTRNEYDLLIVDHGRKIPVGVGVSIRGIPGIVRNRRWSRLIERFDKSLLSARNRLRERGIYLHQPYEERHASDLIKRKSANGEPFKVGVSYATANHEDVSWVIHALAGRYDQEFFYDRTRSAEWSGTRLDRTLNDVFSRIRHVVVFVSKNYFHSRWPEVELNAARESDAIFYFVLVDKDPPMPEWVNEWWVMNLNEKTADNLIAAIDERLKESDT